MRVLTWLLKRILNGLFYLQDQADPNHRKDGRDHREAAIAMNSRKTLPFYTCTEGERAKAQSLENRRNRRPLWVAALITAVYAFFAFEQWRTMQTIFIETERPWVGVSNITIRVQPSDTKLSVVIAVQNSGRSPASHWWYNQAAFAPHDSEDYKNALKGCAGKPIKTGIGTLMLPGLGRETTFHSTPLSPAAIKYIRGKLGITAPQSQGWPPPREADLYLVGCFDYSWGAGHWYRTRFCARYIPDPGPPLGPLDRPIPPLDWKPYGFFGDCNWGNTTDSNP